jgi:hypothetical protein
MQKGVSIGNAMNTLSILIGSTYELGFIKFQRFFKVFVQASPEFRQLPEDVMKLYVKNNRDEMVPFSSFMKIKKMQEPNEINYNMYTTAAIRGGAAKVLVRVRRLLRYNKLPKKHCHTDLILTGLPFLTMKLDVVTKLSISSLSYWHSCM